MSSEIQIPGFEQAAQPERVLGRVQAQVRYTAVAGALAGVLAGELEVHHIGAPAVVAEEPAGVEEAGEDASAGDEQAAAHSSHTGWAWAPWAAVGTSEADTRSVRVAAVAEVGRRR